jgi:LmbE family N-acetylglucosaminyl deacetylase
MKRVLVIAAHPDDEVLGCGGTIAKLSTGGNDVYAMILGEGITSRDESRNRNVREREIKELKGQIERAGRILRVKKTYTFDFPDNRFDTVALLDVVKTIERIKNEIQPEVVFTHHYGDLNIDHQITFKAVMTAFRPLRGESVDEIYSFEVPSSTEWNAPSSNTYFMPNCFIDISKTIKHKIMAMKKYKNEIRDYPHPRSVESIEMKAKQRGVQVGLEAAEAFEIVRQINRI